MMAAEDSVIAANLERLRERVARAARRAGRRPEDVTIVAVSKTFPAEAIRSAYHAGLRHFGENRVQEWESKQARLADLQATWHLIGHLQSNKARRAAHLFRSSGFRGQFRVGAKARCVPRHGSCRSRRRCERKTLTSAHRSQAGRRSYEERGGRIRSAEACGGRGRDWRIWNCSA